MLRVLEGLLDYLDKGVLGRLTSLVNQDPAKESAHKVAYHFFVHQLSERLFVVHILHDARHESKLKDHVLLLVIRFTGVKLLKSGSKQKLLLF